MKQGVAVRNEVCPACDRVFIEGLVVETVIGVFDWERTLRQTLIFDVEMTYDCAPAGAADELALALDYSAVAQRIEAVATASSCRLLETLAEQVAAALLAEFAVGSVRLRLQKPGAVPRARSVGVEIVRHAR